MKTIKPVLAILTCAFFLAGCATADTDDGSQVTRTVEENTTKVISSEPVIGQPPARR